MWWSGAVVVLAAIGAGIYYKYYAQPHVAQTAQQTPPRPPAPAEPAIQHPIPEGAQAPSDATPLPALNDSDPVVKDSLVGLVGPKPVEQFLIPESVVRHIVVTIDNLPRKKVAVELRPVKPTAGQTVTGSQGDITTLSAENYARYAPFIRLVQSTDTKTLTAVYFRLYPLFQQSYEDLGYPGQYFNDRLVQVIDHLLETPDVQGPVELVRPKVFYEYADPKLESRSAGQKLLIRMGDANARAIKAKLRELRAEIVKRK
jgi:hypothetical protein